MTNVANLAFNSLMVNIYRGSDLYQIVDGMIAHMKFQIENPALLNSRFAFDKVLHLDVNFHQLNLTRGRSYVPLPDYIANRKAPPVGAAPEPLPEPELFLRNLNKLSEEVTEVIELRENPKWIMMHSLSE